MKRLSDASGLSNGEMEERIKNTHLKLLGNVKDSVDVSTLGGIGLGQMGVVKIFMDNIKEKDKVNKLYKVRIDPYNMDAFIDYDDESILVVTSIPEIKIHKISKRNLMIQLPDELAVEHDFATILTNLTVNSLLAKDYEIDRVSTGLDTILEELKEPTDKLYVIGTAKDKDEIIAKVKADRTDIKDGNPTIIESPYSKPKADIVYYIENDFKVNKEHHLFESFFAKMAEVFKGKRFRYTVLNGFYYINMESFTVTIDKNNKEIDFIDSIMDGMELTNGNLLESLVADGIIHKEGKEEFEEKISNEKILELNGDALIKVMEEISLILAMRDGCPNPKEMSHLYQYVLCDLLDPEIGNISKIKPRGIVKSEDPEDDKYVQLLVEPVDIEVTLFGCDIHIIHREDKKIFKLEIEEGDTFEPLLGLIPVEYIEDVISKMKTWTLSSFIFIPALLLIDNFKKQ